MSHRALVGLEQIVRRGAVRTSQVHLRAGLSGFNRRLAVVVTAKVGSMPAAYLFMLLALVSLPAAIRSGDVIVIVAWLAQTCLQLVLLPIIIVGQSVQSAHADLRAEQDHEVLQHEAEILGSLHAMQVQQTEILRRLDRPQVQSVDTRS